MQSHPCLHFTMRLAIAKTLLQGTLLITEPDGGKRACKATSGLPCSQHVNSWNLKGRGVIPPCSVAGITSYQLKTQRLWFPNVRGVEGSFYEIDPDIVKVGPTRRGDFGIHWDANVPGSAGCIVLSKQEDWDTFRKLMAEFEAQGWNKIPLYVEY